MKRIPGTNLFFKPELDNGNICVITAGGVLVGNIWWAPKGAYTVELESMEIDHRYQGQGVGEALVREAVAAIAQLYPETRFVTGNATSQGIVSLLRKVFGPERNKANLFRLPRKSPRDWASTENRVHLRFRMKSQEGLAESIVDLLLESPKMEVLKKNRKPWTPEEKSQLPTDCEASILKAAVNGETWYACYTHRAYHADKTISGCLAHCDRIGETG